MSYLDNSLLMNENEKYKTKAICQANSTIMYMQKNEFKIVFGIIFKFS